MECLDQGWNVLILSALQYVVEDQMEVAVCKLIFNGDEAIEGMKQLLHGDGTEENEGLRQEALRDIRNQDVRSIYEIEGDWDQSLEGDESYKSFENIFEKWTVDRLQFRRIGYPDRTSAIARYNYVDSKQGSQTLISKDAFGNYFCISSGAIDIEAPPHHEFRGPLTYPLTFDRNKSRAQNCPLGRLREIVLSIHLEYHLECDDRGVSFAICRLLRNNQIGAEHFNKDKFSTYFRLDSMVELDEIYM